MGHERVGVLPRTKQWRDIVAAVGRVPDEDFEVADLASTTLNNVRQRFQNLQEDDATKVAFTFLVKVAVNAQVSQGRSVADIVNGGSDVTPLKLAKALLQETRAASVNPEYTAIVESSAIDALALWYQSNKPTQQGLFESFDTPTDVWRKAGDGAGFCNLSRLFFSKCVERYLNYFLEREASSVIRTAADRDKFSERLQEHIGDVSEHAFETAKITQSYAAGWFNKYAKSGMPSAEEVDGFLSYSFAKMRDELQRGGTDK